MELFKTPEREVDIKNFKCCESQRLYLRRLQKKDASDMYEYACRSDVTRYLLWSAHPSIEYTSAYISSVQRYYKSGEYFDYAVVLKSEDKMIGTCGFARLDRANRVGEAGYVINPEYQGRGYACEALTALLKIGFFDLKLNRIEARYMTENTASRRVMEKCNMSFEGVQRQLLYVKGNFEDIGICALLREDFLKNNPDEGVSAVYSNGFFGK